MTSSGSVADVFRMKMQAVWFGNLVAISGYADNKVDEDVSPISTLRRQKLASKCAGNLQHTKLSLGKCLEQLH